MIATTAAPPKRGRRGPVDQIRDSATLLTGPVHEEVVGYETPRLFTPPLRELNRQTSLGYALIDFSQDVLGIPMLPWQQWLAIHALELREDNRLRYSTVLVIIARQNGKTTFSQVLALFWLYVLKCALVIGAAQDVALAKEVWTGVCQIIDDLYELRRERQRQPRTTNGQIELELKGHRRYVVRSSNDKSPRGLSGDLVMLDELRAQKTYEGWKSLTATTVARPNSQVWAFSNAGDQSSVVLGDLRLAAHLALGDPDQICAVAGFTGPEASDRMFWAEWSAEPGGALLDIEGLRQANPSLGHGFLTLDQITGRAGGNEWVFRNEHLCQWPSGGLSEPFPPGAWDAGVLPVGVDGKVASQIVGDVTACIEVSWDRSQAAVVYAGRNSEGTPQAEVVAYVTGAEAARDWLTSPDRATRPTIVMLRPNSPAGPVKDDLVAAGLDVRDWKGADVAGACGLLYDLVRRHGGVTHAPHRALDRAAQTAQTRQSGDVWTWDLSRSPVDASPLYALSGALWGLLHEEVAEPVTSFLASGRLVVI